MKFPRKVGLLILMDDTNYVCDVTDLTPDVDANHVPENDGHYCYGDCLL